MDDFEDWLKDTVSATSDQNPSKFRCSPSNQDKRPIQSYNTNQRHKIESGNGQPSSLDQTTNNLPQSNPSGFQHLNGTNFHPDPTSFNPHAHLSASSTLNSRPLMPPPVSNSSTMSRQQKRTHSSFQFDISNKDAEKQKDYENTSHFFGVEDNQRQNQYDNQSYSDLRSEFLQIISKLKGEFDTEQRIRMAIQRELADIRNESVTYIKPALLFSENCAEFLSTFPRQMKDARAAYDDKVRILDRKIAELETLKQQVQAEII
ncbi:uncharacterized protein EAF02_009619 [Botrytis sinoallii]|uniref:uncharacterized protein n=1 Tax=Botrytis sinoallii TaxID=1463999 RepID=UPI001901C3EA|nr:uncharacterized protein EAF02_009619 [Botrytis sinoallii]KAF7868883.1 hypothetical protein EAF02_009619 [Botrytis sinoallii]